MNKVFQPLMRLAAIALAGACLAGCVNQPVPTCYGQQTEDAVGSGSINIHGSDPLCLADLGMAPLPTAAAYNTYSKPATASNGSGQNQNQPPTTTQAAAPVTTAVTGNIVTVTVTLPSAASGSSGGSGHAGGGGGGGGDNGPLPKDRVAGRLMTMYSQGLTYCIYIRNHNSLWFNGGLFGVNAANIGMAAAPVIASALGANTETIGIVTAIQFLFGKQLTDAVSGSWKPSTIQDNQALMAALEGLAESDDRFVTTTNADGVNLTPQAKAGFLSFKVALEGACFSNDSYSAPNSDPPAGGAKKTTGSS
jgi:hypothetical protein